jgi:hypothetical protein
VVSSHGLDDGREEHFAAVSLSLMDFAEEMDGQGGVPDLGPKGLLSLSCPMA